MSADTVADAASRARSGDMIAMLRRHYIADETRPAGIFAAEIAAPTSNRRADLIWQGVTAASGSELHGHEVKVSRSDLLAELADPTKSDPWQRYCDRWWLVVPDPKLIDGLDLPPTWGVLTPPSGRRTRSCTVTVKAPKLAPAEQGPALRTLATWMHWRHHRLATRHDGCGADRERLAEQIRTLRERGTRELAPWEQRRIDVVRDIIRRLGDDIDREGRIGRYGTGDVSVDEVVAALQDLQTAHRDAERIRSETQSAVGFARSTAKRLLQVADEAAGS